MSGTVGVGVGLGAGGTSSTQLRSSRDNVLKGLRLAKENHRKAVLNSSLSSLDSSGMQSVEFRSILIPQ